MAIRSLNRLHRLRVLLIRLRNVWLTRVVGVGLHKTTSVSLSSRLLPGRRFTLTIGAETLVAFKTLIYTTDAATGENRPVSIGARCFIGGGSTVAPGVTIGDECIVGAGAVVLENIPPRCMVGGNPARILRTDIEVGPFGRLIAADVNPGNWLLD